MQDRAPHLHVHVAAATPDLRHLEGFHDHVRIEQMFFDGALDPAGGTLRPDPNAPGLGPRLRREVAQRFRFGRHRLGDAHRDRDGTWTGRTGPVRMRWTGVPAARPDEGRLTAVLDVPAGQHRDLVLELSERALPATGPEPTVLWAGTEAARALPCRPSTPRCCCPWCAAPSRPATRARSPPNRAVAAELAENGYVYRFRPDARSLGEAEGAFALCGFLMALAAQQQGGPHRRRPLVRANRAACGPPGLYAEEYDVQQGQLRGNLPQAFGHALMLEASVRLTIPWTGGGSGCATEGLAGSRLFRR